MADMLWADFGMAFSRPPHAGTILATTICPEPPSRDPGRLYNFRKSLNRFSVRADLQYMIQYHPGIELGKTEANAWVDVFAAYYKFVGTLLTTVELQNAGRAKSAEWPKVYDEWKEVVSALIRGYSNGSIEAWTIPCLFVAGKYLRVFAIKADEQISGQRDSGLAFGGIQDEDAFDPSSQNEKLEDAARQINRIFASCISDRSVINFKAYSLLDTGFRQLWRDMLHCRSEAQLTSLVHAHGRYSNPIHDSRKWALYYVATLLFKTYFKLNHISLSKNILRSLRASNNEMPELSQFPKSHQVPFNFYTGVIHFLDEDYTTAEQHLTAAYEMCQKDAAKNVARILTYLIPTKMLTSHKLPSASLLARHPPLARLFQPLCDAIRSSNVKAFKAVLSDGEEQFAKLRIFLTVERGIDLVHRNVFRRVFLAGGFEPAKEGDAAPTRRTRIPVKEFAAALNLAGADIHSPNGDIDMDEVQCLLGNAIYKDFMKGYIHRDRGIVVLSKGDAFPGTGL